MTNEGREKEDVARYENAYLTLNRKYKFIYRYNWVIREKRKQTYEIKYNKGTYTIGDYEQEQVSDDEADALIQDPKAMPMQDVELANNTLDSVDTLSIQEEPAQVKLSERCNTLALQL